MLPPEPRHRFVRSRYLGALVLGVAVAALIGCQRKPPAPPPPPPPTVPVSHAVEREVTDFSEYTGRTDAVESVSVRARVTGELKAMPFAEGSEVKGPVKKTDGTVTTPGDLLFRIDSEPYQAMVEQAEGQLQLYKAQRVLAEQTYAQDKQAFDSGAASVFVINQDKANIDSAEARIRTAEAALKTARLNLSYTEIRAPISGRVSRYYYTPGNLVSENQTLLTTIVSMEKMYAYFDVEERTFQRLVSGGSDVSAVSVRMAIEGETNYPHAGKLNFINNQVNPSTGTIALRAVFDNERTKNAMWKLLPGMFVRVRLDLGAPYRTQLVIDRAIGSDQGLKFVYVVDPENKVQYRRVKTGALQEDGLRVIEPYKPAAGNEPESGVKPDEWVVVGGLPQLRPRVEVKPDRMAMPTTLPGGDPTQRRRPQGPPPGGKKG